MTKILALAFLFSALSGNVFSQTSVTYDIQDYTSLQTAANGGFAGAFSTTQSGITNPLGMYANSSCTAEAVAYQTFTTTGIGTTGTARPLQPGDNFSITGYLGSSSPICGSPAGAVGISFDDNTTYSSVSNYNTNQRAYIQILNGGSWYSTPATSTYPGAGSNTTFTLYVTSSNTFNLNMNGTMYYDLTMLNSPGTSNRIQSIAMYTLGAGSSNNNYWGSGLLSAAQSINIGQSNTSFTLSGLITDGYTASSSSSASSNTLNMLGTGTVTLSQANTYSGGTNLSTGTLALGIANAIPSTGTVTFAGGTLKSGTTTGYSDALGTATLTSNSTIALGTGSHSLTFANSSGVSWTSGKVLTITGWTGTAGSSGTAGKIFFGSATGGLTAAQLSQISFSGYTAGAQQLSTGEIVPVPGPTISSVVGTSPSISGQATNTGYNGQTITINGSYLGSATTVSVGGTPVTPVTNTASTITFVLPVGASGTVSVTNSYGTGIFAGFANLGYITTANGDWNTTGTWLGATVPPTGSTATVNNTVGVSTTVSGAPASITINSGQSLTLNNAASAITATAVVNNGTLAWTAAGTLTIAASGTLTNNATFTGGTGSVTFAGAGTVNGTTAISFNNLNISTGTLTTPSSGTVPTINGTFTISGGNISAAPKYGASSTLLYNTTYTRYIEWSAISAGTIGTTVGYPNNVTVNTGTLTIYNSGQTGGGAMAGNLNINTGTTMSFTGYGSTFTVAGNVNINGNGILNMSAMSAAANVGGNLTIAGNASGSVIASLNMNTMSGNFSVAGNINNAGSLTLSTTTGVDIYVGGNWIFTQNTGSTAAFVSNGRAVFFNGSSQQLITHQPSAGTLSFDYIVDANTGGGVQLAGSPATSISITAVNTGNGLSLQGTGTGKSFDLNGNTMTLGSGSSVNAGIYVSGAQSIISSTGTGTANVSGGSTASVNGSGTLAFSTAVNVNLSNGFNFGSGLSTINGTLQLNAGGYVNTYPPTYGTNSLLKYNTGATPFVRGAEWNSASGPGYPYNVQVSNNTTIDPAGTANASTPLDLAGSLTIDAGSSFYMDYGLHNMLVNLIIAGNLNLNGNIAESGASGGDIALSGNWINNGTAVNFFANSRSVSFNGTSAQTLGGTNTTAAYAFAYLTINNSSGGVSLGQPVTVATALTMTSGILTTTSSNSLTILTGGGTVGGSTTSYVSGPLTWDLGASLTGSGPYNFPVGGTGYLPFSLSNVSTGSTGPVIKVQATNSGSGGSADGSSVSSISTTEYWNASIVSGNFTSGSVSMARQTGLGSLDAIARSSSQSGSYSTLGGTVSGDGVNNSNATGTSLGYFVFAVFVQPQGSLTANGPFCATGTGQLTWTATAGVGPYTIVYNDGTANRTATGVVSGTPFNVYTEPVTSSTTYTLVSVTDANSTLRSSGFTASSATITVNPIVTPSVSITESPNDPTITYGVSLTFTAAPTNGGTLPTYAFYVGAALEQSGTSNTYTTTTLPVGTDAVKCIMTSNVSCPSATTATSNTISVVVDAGANTWTGAVSNVWTVAGNWTTGVPSCSLDGIIPSNVTTYPVITSSVSVRNLTLQIDAFVTMSGAGTLSVCGNMSAINTQTLAGSVVLQGTGAQTLTGTYNFNNLEVNGNYTVGSNSSDKISVAGILNKASGTLNTNNKLTIVATSTQTGLIADNGGSLAGNVSMQQYVSGNVGYHHISSPMSSSTVGNLSGFSIFGTNGVRSGYYLQEGSLEEYTESVNTFPVTDSGFYNYTSLSNPLTPATGYSAMFPDPPTVMATYGSPNNGTVTVTVTNTAGHAAGVEGWNFVGNPYPSPISWSAVKSLNSGLAMNGSCYIWKPSSPTAGTWAADNGTATNGNGLGNVIPSSQGFWIDATAAGSHTLTFNNTVRTQTLSPLFYKAPELLANELRLNISSATDPGCEALMYTDASGEGSAVIPPMQTFITSPTISYMNSEDHNLIYVAPSIDENTETPLAIHIGAAGSYTITASSINVAGMPVYILDNATGTYYDMSSQTVMINSQGNDNINGRYSVVYSKKTKQVVSNTVTIYGKTAAIAIERVNGDNPAQVIVTDMLGREIANTTATGSSIEIPVADAYAIYMVSVISNDTRTVKKVIVKE